MGGSFFWPVNISNQSRVGANMNDIAEDGYIGKPIIIDSANQAYRFKTG
jgi:hypothetical protein